MRVDVLDAELPHIRELGTNEQRRREWQPTAERLADTEDVRDVGARPELADAAEPGEDRVDDEERSGVVTALPQGREELFCRNPRASPSLYGLDDHDTRIVGKRAWILSVCAPVHRPRQPRFEGLAKPFQACGREREQPGAVIRAVERDDARLARRQQR